jgi:hypothetical protein
MSGPGYHGRTHLPGGTDPVQFSAIKTASFSAGQRSRSITGGGTTTIDFSFMWSNDSSFGLTDTHGSAPVRANYITISESGLYLAQGQVNTANATRFSGTDFAFIEIEVFYPSDSSTDFLINAKDEAGWDDGQSPIYGEMLTASEYAHASMVETIWFNFDPAVWGEDTLGIGVCVGSSNTVTKTIGGSLVVARMGDLLTETAVS